MGTKHLGIKATIVMPRTTPQIKVDAVRSRGAKVVLHGDSYDEASAHAQELVEQKGLTYIHPRSEERRVGKEWRASSGATTERGTNEQRRSRISRGYVAE